MGDKGFGIGTHRLRAGAHRIEVEPLDGLGERLEAGNPGKGGSEDEETAHGVSPQSTQQLRLRHTR